MIYTMISGIIPTRKETTMTTKEKTNTITIGEKTFVPMGKLAGALFVGGGTPDGEYKKLKTSINFYKPSGEVFAALIMNKHGERFFVSAHKDSNSGRTRYMFGLCDSSYELLGLSVDMGLREEREIAENVAEMFE